MLDFLRHAPWGRYLRFSAGTPTSRVVLWVWPTGICGGVGFRDDFKFEDNLSLLPELPPFVDGGQGGTKGAFLARLRKRVSTGPRPGLTVLLDTPQAFIQIVPISETRATNVESLLETLQNNPREIFKNVEQEYRWILLDSGLGPLKSGRLPGDRVVVVGIPEEEAAETEAWARAQGFILDAILPAAVAAAVFLIEAFNGKPAAGVDACFVIGTAVNAHRLLIENRAVTAWEIHGGNAAHSLMANMDELFGEHPSLRDALQLLWEFENQEEPAQFVHPNAQRLEYALSQTLSWWTSV